MVAREGKGEEGAGVGGLRPHTDWGACVPTLISHLRMRPYPRQQPSSKTAPILCTPHLAEEQETAAGLPHDDAHALARTAELQRVENLPGRYTTTQYRDSECGRSGACK